MRDQHSPRCARNGIQTEVCLIGKSRQFKGRLSEAFFGRVHCEGDMLGWQPIGRFPEYFQNRGQQVRSHDDEDHQQCPKPGRRQERPAEQQ